jgi:hypothetical protein
MAQFSKPYRIGQYWAVDHLHNPVSGCLAWFFNLFGYSSVMAVTTYTTDDPKIAIFWRNIKTGFRPNIFLAGDIQDHFEAWQYRQTMAQIKGFAPGAEETKSENILDASL